MSGSLIQRLGDFDIRAFLWVNSNHTRMGDIFFRICSILGLFFVMGAIYTLLLLANFSGNDLHQVLALSILAFVFNGVLARLLKQAIRRSRPVRYFSRLELNSRIIPLDYIPSQVHLVGERLLHRSFPSGHSNTAFTTATLLVLLFGWPVAPIYLLAFLIAYSRVYSGAHWPLDTLGGALIGTLGTLLVNGIIREHLRTVLGWMDAVCQWF